MTMTKVDFSSLARLADRFGNGELLSDTLSPAGPRLSKVFTKGIVKAMSRFRSRRSACCIG
jgi:hypothetical protein